MNKSYNKKNYYPTKKKYYPKKKNTSKNNTNKNTINPNSFLGQNIANNMRFGNPGDTISGYVKREVVIKDGRGNMQIAREQQFFNSGKGYKMRINGNSNDNTEY